MTKLIGIYGAGGCGRGIMPLARSISCLGGDRLVFIDDAKQSKGSINGHDVVTFTQFVSDAASSKQVAIAIANPRVRADIARRLIEYSIPLASILSDQTVMMDEVEIGVGALVSPFVTFTSNIRIGCCFHANLNSYIEHDCVIGDFVTFAPGVHCNGNVRIGDLTYIGAGAMIRQGLTIGANAVVGMGAVVIKDVPDGVTVVGNPAKILET